MERYFQHAYPNLVITPRTAACKWTGECVDYSIAIESMQWHERHHDDQDRGAVPPDTS